MLTKKAKKLISQAKSAGAHAAKFQTYKADKIASKFSKDIGIPQKKRQSLSINYFLNLINLHL